MNPPGKFPELFLILLIRSSSGILADNGMLCNGGYCSYDTAACPPLRHPEVRPGCLHMHDCRIRTPRWLLRRFLSSCAGASLLFQVPGLHKRAQRSPRTSSGVKARLPKSVLLSVKSDWENFAGPFPCQHIGDFFGAAGWAKRNFINFS